MKHFYFLPALAGILFSAMAAQGRERVILLNEGTWQADNGRITYFEDGRVVSNQWFRDVNGTKLGDTPNDIIRVSDSMLAISVNMSNIVQFITPDGRSAGTGDDVASCRKLASDGNFVYVTSYAHECATEKGTMSFRKGFVAKIDVNTLKTVDAVEVGYEPEGIALYRGHLFVANTGSYAFSENHDYESTVSVIDPATMQVLRTIDVEQINPSGRIALSGQYLCISSPGDYYEVPAATIIFDCDAALDGKSDKDCHVNLSCIATYPSTAADGRFFAAGSTYSYATGSSVVNSLTIDPARVFATRGAEGVTENGLPGTVNDDLKKLTTLNDLYVNPYTGYIYATDATDYTSAGALWQWNAEGRFQGKYEVYISPAHLLALADADSAIPGIAADSSTAVPVLYYNLQGVASPVPHRGINIIRYSDGTTRKSTL